MNITDIVQNYVEKKKRNNPSLSVSSIAKTMGVPQTTLNRILNGYSENPKLETLLKLSKHIPELKEMLPKELSTAFKVLLSSEESNLTDDKDLQILLGNKENFICWLLSFAPKGVSEKEVISVLGERGTIALKCLKEKNVIIKVGDFYKVKDSSKSSFLSFELIKKQVVFLSEFYKPSNIQNNYIHYILEHLNEEGTRKVMKIQQECHKRIQRVMQDEEYQGEIPVFSIGCSDTLKDADSKKGDL